MNPFLIIRLLFVCLFLLSGTGVRQSGFLKAEVFRDYNLRVDASLKSKKMKIAYVTDPAGECYPKDIRILPVLIADTNFLVTVLSGTFKNNDFTPYDLVVLSEVTGSTAAGLEMLKGINKPFLMMKVHAYKTAHGAWNWTNSATAFGQDTTETNLVVSDKTHPLFKGVKFINTNEIQMLSFVDGGQTIAGAKGLTFMNPQAFTSVKGGTIKSLASVKNNVAQTSILEIPAGTCIAGTIIPNKFIQIGINGLSYKKVSEDGLKIIMNACYYLTGKSIPQSKK